MGKYHMIIDLPQSFSHTHLDQPTQSLKDRTFVQQSPYDSHHLQRSVQMP